MKKKMFVCSFLFIVLTAVCVFLLKTTQSGIWMSAAITCGTVSYHLVMRLAVGYIFNLTMKNHADFTKKRYKVHGWEMKLYKKLKIRKLRSRIPTFDKSAFDPGIHTWTEIAEAGCQAESVHETIMVLSFLPIFAGLEFGAFPVFIITSFSAAAVDGIFVMVQRFTRPEIIRIINRRK